MRKAEREKRMEKLAKQLMYWNEILYTAEDNETRMEAAQKCYVRLGMLIGYAEGDITHPILWKLRQKQSELFGNWAVISWDSWFRCFDGPDIKDIGREHKKELEERK